MIDLSANIRTAIVSDIDITALIANYQDSKAIFTRRPVPSDAAYPMIIISPLVSETNLDGLRCKRAILTYDISVYDTNASSVNYRNVEVVGYKLANKFHRMDRFAMSFPSGVSLIKSTARGPFAAPTDDLVKVARVVSVEFEVSY